MVRSKGKLYLLGDHKAREKKDKLNDEIDGLFKLPLAEFTAARNILAAQLKKSGRGNDATDVKALVKPSTSAWTVNQLYWQYRAAFDQLIAAGGRFHKAQSSRSTGKLADMRSALDARRETLRQLSDRATSLLHDAGHNPTPDTIHRITTTLEAMSAYTSQSDGPTPGRLTHDVDPPGFESLGGFITSAGITQLKELPTQKSQSSAARAATTKPKVSATLDTRPREDKHKEQIAAARVSLDEAKRSLMEAKASAGYADRALKKVKAAAGKAEQQRTDAEEALAKAKTTYEDASRRVRSLAVEAESAARAVKYAERGVERAVEELERLSRAKVMTADTV